VTRPLDFHDVVTGPGLGGDGEPARPALARPGHTGSRLDDWADGVRDRWLTTPARRRIARWLGPALVTVLAAVLRLTNLGTPRALVFDETYYVKDAYTLLRLGYEGSWPENPNPAFEAGDVDTFTSVGSFIAHPPLGKWIIALGLQVFGADDPVGWRISTAVVGILAVALVCVIAMGLFRSSLLATIAGGMMAIDGLAISMSRSALLDNSLMLLCLSGFGAILLDRRQSAGRLADWLARRADAGLPTDWGPSLWWRPWLVTAGLFFGLASGVKWSGAYFLAGFAVYTLVVDAVARRRAGIRFWASSTLFRQAPVSFLLLVPIAAIAYVATWTGWFLTDGGYGRGWAAEQLAGGNRQISDWVPLALQSFWHYQETMYNSNLGVDSEHAYQANPLTWLLMTDPTVFYRVDSTGGSLPCDTDLCYQYVSSMATPVLWWLAVAAALYLAYRLVRYREWRVGLILTGIAAGYLPWLLYTERTVFQFYSIVFLPYLLLAFTAVIGLLLGSREQARWRRVGGIRLVTLVLVVVVLAAAFFYSMASAIVVSGEFQRLHDWLPQWR
jgi:dolichyl-phosphate-mannose--protein O-mannosyl transferase